MPSELYPAGETPTLVSLNASQFRMPRYLQTSLMSVSLNASQTPMLMPMAPGMLVTKLMMWMQMKMETAILTMEW